MPNIFERSRVAWSTLIGSSTPAATPQGVVDNSGLNTVDAILRTWGSIFAVDMDRQQLLKDFDRMDTGDIAVMLDQTVEAATIFEERESEADYLLKPEGVKLAFDGYGTAKAKKVVTRFLEDTNLRSEIPVYARDLLKYGDAFAELVPATADDSRIVRVIHKLVPQMRVNRDKKGRLVPDEDPDNQGQGVAYQQLDSSGLLVAGWFPNGEMVHGKLYPDSALTYSQRGILNDIREDWKKQIAVEQGMVIARIVRAYPRMLHTLDMSGKGAKEAEELVQKYVNAIKYRQRQDGVAEPSFLGPAEDLFLTTGHLTDKQGTMVPKLNRIELMDPDIAGLSAIADVEFSRRKLWSRVPGSTVGIQDNQQQELTAQDIAYGRLILRLQMRLEAMLREIIDVVLDRAGIDPATVDYRCLWPNVVIGSSWKYADAEFRKSMADRNDLEAGFTSVQAVMRSRGLSDDEITKAMTELLAYQRQQTDLEVEKAKALAAVEIATAKALAKIVPTQTIDTTADKDIGTSTRSQTQPAASGGATGGGTSNTAKAAKSKSPGNSTSSAGNQKRRTTTKTTKTTGVGQGTAGAKSGGGG